jgi:hypothetical protein
LGNKLVDSGFIEPANPQLEQALRKVGCSMSRDLRALPVFEMLLKVLQDNSLFDEMRKYGLAYTSVFTNTYQTTLETIKATIPGFEDYFDTLSTPNRCGFIKDDTLCVSGYGLIDSASFKQQYVKQITVLDDRTQGDNYMRSWRYFLRMFNLLQLQDVLFLTESGLQRGIYGPLFCPPTTVSSQAVSVQPSEWEDVLEDIFDEAVRKLAVVLIDKGMRAPDDIGYEFFDEKGAIVCEVELIWFEEKRVVLRRDQMANVACFVSRGYEVLKGGE